MIKIKKLLTTNTEIITVKDEKVYVYTFKDIIMSAGNAKKQIELIMGGY